MSYWKKKKKTTDIGYNWLNSTNTAKYKSHQRIHHKKMKG